MEEPEIIILEESPPPSPSPPSRRGSSEEEDDEKMLKNTSLSVDNQVIFLKRIIAGKQGEIDILTDNLEKERGLRKKVERKYNRLKGAFAEITGEIGGIVKDLKGKKGKEDCGNSGDILKRELDQLSGNLKRRLEKSEENTVTIRGELEVLNKQLENFIRVHLPQSVAVAVPKQPEVVVTVTTVTPNESQLAPVPEPTPAPLTLPAKRLSIKPVRLVEELTIQQNLKKVKRQVAFPPPPLKKKFPNNHAIDTSRNNQKTFYCICRRRFCSRGKVRDHVKYHTKEWKFRCDLCGWRCAGANYLRQHYQQVHKIKMASKFGCRECGWMLDTRRELLRHQAALHKKAKATSEVTMATGNEDVQEILEIDDDDDIQEIPIVTKAPSLPPPQPDPSPPTLSPQETRGSPGYDGNFHGKDVSKEGDSRHHCFCGKSYNHSPTLLHHIKYQTWPWRFRCSECGLLFYGANYLRKHMVSTHKVNPGLYIPTFGCRRCGKLYKQYKQLVLHQRLAHRISVRNPLE